MNAMISAVVITQSRKPSRTPALCLARFDKLAEIGMDAFTKRWDPCWDVPLDESLPEPVIELPALTTLQSGPTMELTDLVC